MVFVEDYGIEVAGELVQGVDLWLNTPRRGEEACGTSGMKAGINGILNLSILDGWFDEAAENSGGWAIGDREPYSPDRDDAHATAIYSLLENEIVPLFYEAREHGVPMRWMRRVRAVSALRERAFQQPAHGRRIPFGILRAGPSEMGRDGAGPVRRGARFTRWSRETELRWPGVAFNAGERRLPSVLNGGTIPLRAGLDLAGLSPKDVRVEAVVGRIGPRGNWWKRRS